MTEVFAPLTDEQVLQQEHQRSKELAENLANLLKKNPNVQIDELLMELTFRLDESGIELVEDYLRIKAAEDCLLCLALMR